MSSSFPLAGGGTNSGGGVGGHELEPLQKLLQNLQIRLAVVENHVGLVVNPNSFPTPSPMTTKGHKRISSTASSTFSIATSTTSHGGYGGGLGDGSSLYHDDDEIQQQEAENGDRIFPPCLASFDTVIIQSSLEPLLDSLTALKLDELVSPLREIWNTQRNIIQMATYCKKPTGKTLAEALSAQLVPIQSAMKQIQTLLATDKKYRPFDTHGKAIQELLVGVSWLVMTPPPTSPSIHVKDTLASTDFWMNKIRKQYKSNNNSNTNTATTSENKDNDDAKKHITFCDAMKLLILNMATYVKEYHSTGLCWNAHGLTIQEYKPEEPKTNGPSLPPPPPPTPSVNTTSSATNNTNWMKELESKQTQDGNSAATGLKKVNKDQQTWRKEYVPPTTTTSSTASTSSTIVSATKMKFESSKLPNHDPTVNSNTTSPPQKKTIPSKATTISNNSSSINVKDRNTSSQKELGGIPICEYQASSNKWIIENQNTTNNPNCLCTIEVQDVKTQVYIFKCNQVTIQIRGKLKSIILDSCIKTNVLFETTISSCETVNCQKIQIQCTGTCPTFAIDKTDGCLVFLSKESLLVSQFVTSKSSEMNIEWEDGKTGEIKECPIPEQFVHRWNTSGSVTSSVSDIYH